MPRRHITFMYVVWTLSTVAIAGYGLASFPWQLMLASFVFNALEGAGTIVWATTKGRLVPARLLGRVSSFDWFISTGLVPFSFALTGPVAAIFGPRTTLVGAGILGGVVTLGFLFLPGMRDVERSGDLAGPRRRIRHPCHRSRSPFSPAALRLPCEPVQVPSRGLVRPNAD